MRPSSVPPDGVFTDRVDAGRRLAETLHALQGRDIVVLGLPRGGVPVANEVASALLAPLDVIVVRKLGIPHQPEVALGAIGEGGTRVVDTEMMARARVSAAKLDVVERDEEAALADRVTRFRRARGRIDLAGRTALIVDDGIATGATARAACRVARQLGAASVIVAAPVGPVNAARLIPEADDVFCVLQPTRFWAVGAHYRDFRPTTDDEVVSLLQAALPSSG